ncbi:uncharacterized protein JCM10292_001120 [Rhodotorula paludigena]|uniref:uncharacterized protein n=1 Tax=Rhodotorula paludigena TaxID=86838 RepID=UPI00317B7572
MAASDRHGQVGVTGQGTLQAALGLLGAFFDWAKLEAPEHGVSLALDGVPALVVASLSLPPHVASAAVHLLANGKMKTKLAPISFACDITMSKRYQGPMRLRNLVRDLSSGYADPENPDWVYVYAFHLQESIISTLCLDSGNLSGAWLNPTDWEPAIHAIVGLYELDHFRGQVHQRLSDEFARDLDNKTLHHGVLRPWSECFAMYRNAISNTVKAVQRQLHQYDDHATAHPTAAPTDSQTSPATFSASAPTTPSQPSDAPQASASTVPNPAPLNVTSAFDNDSDSEADGGSRKKRGRKKQDKTKKENLKEAKKEKAKSPHVPGTRRAAWAGIARRLFKGTSERS